MRNTKNAKGFTLVELIVVIAIIGVLAAILVPSMLGFVRDARISQANSNAKTVYTSMQAWLTKYIIAHDTAATKKNGTAQVTFGPTPKATYNAIVVTGSGATPPLTTVDGTGYFGEGFNGFVGGRFTEDGTTVEYACWAAEGSGMAASNLVAAGKKVPTAEQQETAVKSGKILIGFHPIGTDSTSGAYPA